MKIDTITGEITDLGKDESKRLAREIRRLPMHLRDKCMEYAAGLVADRYQRKEPPMTDKLFKIKPLVWEYNDLNWRAETPVGPITIYPRYPDGDRWGWFGAGRDIPKNHTLAEAKAAAEAHYRERMAAGLVEVEVPVKKIRDACQIIEDADDRAMAVDGDVVPTDKMMTPKQVIQCFQALWSCRHLAVHAGKAGG